MKHLRILIIPMLPTLYGRRYQISKYLALKNEVHLILWDMPYPITLKNVLFNLRNSWNCKKFKNENITIHKIRRLPFFFPIVNKWLFQKQVRKIFNDFNIDIIISQSFTNETDPPLDLPIIRDLNDYYEAYAQLYGSIFYKLAYKFLDVKNTVSNQIIRAKAVFAVSDILVDQAQKLNSNVHKIPNGVESWVLSKKYGTKKYNFGSHSLVYVSYFGKWSGLLNLLRVIFVLKKVYEDVQLIVIGDGPLISKAKNLIKELHLEENIKLLGNVWDRDRLFEIVNSCEVCLNISKKNIFKDAASPIKIFEYSALGKKIVSSNLAEVQSLGYPNIFIYNEDINNNNLIKTIKYAFHKNISEGDIKLRVRQSTWENITNRMVKIIEDIYKNTKNEKYQK